MTTGPLVIIFPTDSNALRNRRSWGHHLGNHEVITLHIAGQCQRDGIGSGRAGLEATKLMGRDILLHKFGKFTLSL